MRESEHPLTSVSPAAMMVRESVGSLASQAVSQDVIIGALRRGDLRAVPAGGRALRAFIELHLHRSAAAILGQDAADAILQTLGPIVHRIPSEIPPRISSLPVRDRDEMETEVPDSLATVLLATLDGDRARQLQRALAGVRLTVVRDVVALLDIVTANALSATVIVLDCVSPAVHPATLATVAPEMDRGTEFVLWDAGEAQGDRWLFAERTDTWVRCPRGADIHQVAKAIRALMP